MSMFETIMFRDRTDAGHQLGERLMGRRLIKPLVLAIPRGGVVTGLALARVIDAELDVVLSRKLRAPFQPEYALGAISEDGQVTLNREAMRFMGMTDQITYKYLEKEKEYQMAEIERRKKLFRVARPQAQIGGRSVIVTDDGIATGSTMVAALQSVREKGPHELIVAVPVAAPDRLEPIRHLCDAVVCLRIPENFHAVGQFYKEFDAIEDEEVVQILRDAFSYRQPIGARTDRIN